MSQEEKKSDEKGTQQGKRYICFNLGTEEYAIPLLTVREVIAVPEITHVPFSPPYFLGIMNLRGQVISVIDLRQKLGIKPNENSETAVIICDLAPLSLGLVVDSINSVLSPKDDEVSEKPEMPNNKNTEYITNVYRKANQLILMLDIKKTLTGEDQAALKKGSGSSKAA